MRKFLWVVAVGAVVLAMAAPAMALDFKFSSSNRFRVYSTDGIGAEPGIVNGIGSTTGTVAASPFAKATTNNVSQGDTRFRPWFRVSDDNGNVVSEVRLEIGDVRFGNTATGGNVGSDGVNVETKWAYVDVALPFGLPARLRGGMQPYFLPKGLLVDDDGGGIRLYGTVKPVSYDFWWLAANEAAGSATTTGGGQVGGAAVGPANDDIDYYAGKIDLALSPWLNPYVYGIYRHGTVGAPGSSDSSDGGWFGIGSTGKIAIVKYDLDFVWGSDGALLIDAATLDKRTGFVLDGGVEAPVGPVAVGLRGMYATGDKSGTADKNEDFPALRRGAGTTMSSYTVSGHSQLFWDSAGSAWFAGGYTGTPANTWTFGGYASYTPVKALNLKLAYFYIGAPQKNTNFYTGKASIGHEISLVGTYQLWTGTKAVAIAGAILPPDKGREVSTGAEVDLKMAQAYAFVIQHDF